MKKIFIVILLLIGAAFGAKTLIKPAIVGVPDDQAELILFWGDGCPHCVVVKDFINANQVGDKIKIAYKEVYYNKNNQNFLTETVKKCPEIDSTQGVGVPLGFSTADNRCLYGDTPIIDWIKAKMIK